MNYLYEDEIEYKLQQNIHDINKNKKITYKLNLTLNKQKLNLCYVTQSLKPM